MLYASEVIYDASASIPSDTYKALMHNSFSQASVASVSFQEPLEDLQFLLFFFGFQQWYPLSLNLYPKFLELFHPSTCRQKIN